MSLAATDSQQAFGMLNMYIRSLLVARCAFPKRNGMRDD